MSTKYFNIRLTGDHSKTRNDVKTLKSRYKVYAYTNEDIGWQNGKPEKPHMHVIIETVNTNQTIQKFINDVLNYHGNEQYKIGRPIENLENALKYLCKGKSLGDYKNVVSEYLDIDQIKKYNSEFWSKKIENDENYKKKGESLRMSILKIIDDKECYTTTDGYVDYKKLMRMFIAEYVKRHLGYSRNQIEKYVNLTMAKIDIDDAVDNLINNSWEFKDGLPHTKVRSSIYDIEYMMKNPKKIDYEKCRIITESDEDIDELENPTL